MADCTLEITLRSATDLKKVNLVSKMEVYAVVSISGGGKKYSNQKVRTPPDRDGGSNPSWDFPIRFAVETAPLQEDRLTLDFKLVCERALGDKDVGEVHVSVKELFDSPTNGSAAGGWRFVSYQVKKPSGRPKGQLTFSYKLSGITAIAKAPTKKVCGKSLTLYPVVELKSRSVDQSEPMPTYPVVEMDSDSVYPPVVNLDSISIYPPVAKVDGESMAAYPMANLDSKSAYPPVAKVRGELLTAYPREELDFKSVYPPPPANITEKPKEAYLVTEMDSNSVYPPATKVYDEPTAANLAVLDSKSVYPPAGKVHTSVYPAVELKSNSVYPPLAKVHEEPRAVRPAVELESNLVYRPAAKVRDDPAAVELVSNSVYPPLEKVYNEPTAVEKVDEDPTAAYPKVELKSNSVYPPAATGQYPNIPLYLYPAIEVAGGIGEHDMPPLGWFPPPYVYESEPFYAYPAPPPPCYVYPPLPPAMKSKFSMELHATDLII